MVHGNRNQVGNVFGTNVQAGAVHGGIHVHYASNGRSTSTRPPLQLLPAPACFTGRDQELLQLDKARGARFRQDAAVVVVVSGTAGVGKTALALHWLHRVRRDFPNTQLYTNLRGYDRAGPVMPAEVLLQFLLALGVPGDQVPTELADRATLYRSVTAEQPILAMLDNAISSAQVRPLLPGHPASLVVVTSRQRLGGLALDGARFVQLTPLRQDAAIDLLDQTLGDERVAEDRASAETLAKLCGRLPIALRVAAARLAVRPHWSIRRAVADMTREQRRLATLSVEGNLSVAAAFDLSHQALPADAARLYGLLGLHPGDDFDSSIAAALNGSTIDAAEGLLEILVDANLLEDLSDDRYRFHDLVRLHARQQADGGSPAEQDEAIARLLDWYLYVVDRADRIIMPGRPRADREYESRPEQPFVFDDTASALAWLEAERANVMAVLRYAAELGKDRVVWQLTDALWSLFVFRKHYGDWIESHEIGVASARACSHEHGLTMLLNHLGLGYHDTDRFDDALRCFEEASEIHEARGDRYGQATELNGIGMTLRRLGRTSEAIDRLTTAAGVFTDLNQSRSEALVRINLGDAYADVGHYDAAAENLQQAVSVMAAISDQHNEARALQRLARVRARSGRMDDATRDFRRALATLRELGARLAEAEVLEALGDTARDTGDLSEAKRFYTQALEIFSELGAPRQVDVQARLASLT